MRFNRLIVLGLIAAAIALGSLADARAQQNKATIDQFISPAFPYELVSARKADRIAWIAYERGMRNVYSAVAPDFKPVRLTNFLNDDGNDLTALSIADDGGVVVFVRKTPAYAQSGRLDRQSGQRSQGERASDLGRQDHGRRAVEGGGGCQSGAGAGRPLDRVRQERSNPCAHTVLAAKKPGDTDTMEKSRCFLAFGTNSNPT